MSFRALSRIVAVLVIALFLLALLPLKAEAAVFPNVNGTRLSSYEARLAHLVNKARTDRGLKALVVTPGTTDMARDWANRMAAENRMYHRSDLKVVANYGSPSWTAVSENVGTNPGGNPDVIFNAYMNSAGHKKNILDTRMTHVGFGAVSRAGIVYDTMNFVNSYSTAYGPSRHVAHGTKWSSTLFASTAHLATFESGSDPRFLSQAGGSGVTVSKPVVAAPTAGDDPLRFTVKATSLTATGHANVTMRDGMDFTKARILRVKVGSTTPTGRSVKVPVYLQESYGTSILVGTITVPGNGSHVTADIALPLSTQLFRNQLVLQVPATSLAGISTTLSQRTVTVSVYSVTVVV